MLDNFGEGFATIGIFVALAWVPLLLVSVIMQALPMLFVLFAFLFLKEKSGIHGVGAFAVGLVVF